MNILSHALAGVALMASAVIYGTDVFCAIVQRPALARVDDRALTCVTGRVHRADSGGRGRGDRGRGCDGHRVPLV